MTLRGRLFGGVRVLLFVAGAVFGDVSVFRTVS